jgi:hypothetical protein
MKKFIAFVAVVGFAMAFVACGKKAETAVEETPAATEEVVDSAAAAPADTAAVAVDSAAAQ